MSQDPDFLRLRPILALTDGTVYAGNQRLKAAKELGMEKVWAVLEDVDETTMKARALRDNNQWGEWEPGELSAMLDEIPEDLQDLLGFDDLKSMKAEQLEVVEDEAPEPPKEPKSKLGDLYQLGEHRLLCGDATKMADVEKLMDGQKADMVHTDPPYGMDLDTDYSQLTNDNFGVESKKYSKVIGDDKPFNMVDFHWIDCAEQFWWGADWYRESVPAGGSWFCWDKRVDEALDNMYGSAFELCWSKKRHQRLFIRHKFSSFFGSSDAKNRVHPTQKALGVCAFLIEKYGKKDDLVLDLFGGSGSTLIACEQLNRKCYMMELDPRYVDVIVQRWETLTGNKAQLLNG